MHRLSLVLLLALSTLPIASAGDASRPCSHEINERSVGAVLQCRVDGGFVTVVGGEGQKATCDRNSPNIVVILGANNEVNC